MSTGSPSPASEPASEPPEPSADPPAASSPAEPSQQSLARQVVRKIHLAAVWPGWMNLASMLTTVAAVGALWFTNNTLRATQDQARATQGQLELSQRTAVTDMFQKAVEMLRSDGEPGEPENAADLYAFARRDGIDVRIAGIRLLERLAQESPRDRRLAYQTIATFVQTRTPRSMCTEWEKLAISVRENPATPEHVIQMRYQELEESMQDVTVALEVIGKRPRDAESDRDQIDLRKVCLRQTTLRGNFANVNFDSANLQDAAIIDADVSGANFDYAYLHGTVWTLAFADGPPSRLAGASFKYTDLTNADLTEVDLTGVDLSSSNLEGAVLHRTNLTRADLSDSHLSCVDATQAIFDQTVLADIYYSSEGTQWPEGFVPPASDLPYSAYVLPKCE
ncbi:pentapeptide repeat-containing protein [Nocardia neocaledoniensis]|uniref:pentapeptide repeat-containing protein n=1 Tax=Nocardia neocaledoniensis TaxID=236511 RepID=UPI0024551B43|nr:pentapeptide repeat-containing protein [Nocardia neocaledoniensis]